MSMLHSLVHYQPIHSFIPKSRKPYSETCHDLRSEAEEFAHLFLKLVSEYFSKKTVKNHQTGSIAVLNLPNTADKWVVLHM